ncbi:hypothetical protein [uncultured Sulfitobacter sp.]|uniref:hypothetical protein n=1 Tax=uncultured Sulfitobacter sp. TaxID=191468 RepID=UPI0026317945|nr:hypothetical protein [uncultured Sulfitobacter sp.]
MRSTLAIVMLAFLAACGSATSPNELAFTTKDGLSSGRAGAEWSDNDLRSNAFGALCRQGQKVTDLKITRAADGTAEFTFRCKA